MDDDTRNDEQYLSLVSKVLKEGQPRNDRTGTGTLAVFGEFLEFDLRDNRLPIIN